MGSSWCLLAIGWPQTGDFNKTNGQTHHELLFCCYHEFSHVLNYAAVFLIRSHHLKSWWWQLEIWESLNQDSPPLKKILGKDEGNQYIDIYKSHILHMSLILCAVLTSHLKKKRWKKDGEEQKSVSQILKGLPFKEQSSQSVLEETEHTFWKRWGSLLQPNHYRT